MKNPKQIGKRQNNSIVILCCIDGRNPNFKKSYIGTIPDNINNIFRYDHMFFSKNILKKSVQHLNIKRFECQILFHRPQRQNISIVLNTSCIGNNLYQWSFTYKNVASKE